MQRNPWTAATIVPVPGGVIIKPAMTTAQFIVVGLVLVFLVLGVLAGGAGPV